MKKEGQTAPLADWDITWRLACLSFILNISFHSVFSSPTPLLALSGRSFTSDVVIGVSNPSDSLPREGSSSGVSEHRTRGDVNSSSAPWIWVILAKRTRQLRFLPLIMEGAHSCVVARFLFLMVVGRWFILFLEQYVSVPRTHRRAHCTQLPFYVNLK